MSSPAWEEIPLERYDDHWGPFDARYHFSPSLHGGPAIDEPSPSVTIDLAPVLQATSPAVFAAGEQALNALAVLAMVRAFPEDQRLLVLDWQHPSHWFWPHRQVLQPEPRPWLAFPNGDYYAVLTEDLSTGTFGHPWEQTLCVFGAPLLKTLVPLLASWLPTKRAKPAG